MLVVTVVTVVTAVTTSRHGRHGRQVASPIEGQLHRGVTGLQTGRITESTENAQCDITDHAHVTTPLCWHSVSIFSSLCCSDSTMLAFQVLQSLRYRPPPHASFLFCTTRRSCAAVSQNTAHVFFWLSKILRPVAICMHPLRDVKRTLDTRTLPRFYLLRCH